MHNRPANQIDVKMTRLPVDESLTKPRMINDRYASATPVRIPSPINRAFSVAPMLDWTDRHCRHFMRLLTRRSLLYTEMVTVGAILRGDRDHYLRFEAFEQPLALQLGGGDPRSLAKCAKIAESYGYSEVNLNCGCPSNKVQQGQFGACLMKQPQLVADCIVAMRDAVSIPVTIKHRTGIDRETSYDRLAEFVGNVADAGCHTFIVHARAAWLDGINPKQNRTLPPLDYNQVYRLKADFPEQEFVLNGGINSLVDAKQHLLRVDGVMMGREAYNNPFILAGVDQYIHGESPSSTKRLSVLEQLIPYAEIELRDGVRLHQITRHILGLFHGQPGARRFRQLLSSRTGSAESDVSLLAEALALMNGFSGFGGDNRATSLTDAQAINKAPEQSN